MSAQRVLACLAILIVAVIATQVYSIPQGGVHYYANNATNKSHDLTIGYRLPGDRLVARQSVQKNSSFMRVVVVEQKFNTTRNERITMVRALDQKSNGNGAYASLLNGGPGFTNVTLRFKSQRGHGINFIVELYARP